MPRGLKIAHKGIILVALPLIFELLFLGILSVLLLRADDAIRREARSKQVIFSINVIQRKITVGGTSAAIYKFTHSKAMKERCIASLHEVLNEFRALRELMKDDAEALGLLDKAQAATEEGAGTLDRLIKTVDKDQSVKSIFGNHGESGLREERKLIDAISSNLSVFNQREQDAAQAYTAAERRARQAVAWALVAGVILNIILAVWLARYFSRNITGRISSVIENTRRITKNLPMNPPITGSDELAELDQVFHDTIQELQKAEEAKAYLIGMVSHDLRSPLTSVQAALTLLKEGVLGELPERAYRKLASAEEDVGRVIKLSNDLLDAQRLSSGKLSLLYDKVSAQKLTADAVETVRTASEQHQVSIDQCVDDFEVDADGDRLLQVLVNLLSNAIRFSPSGGTIKLNAQQHDGMADFRVSDNGPGIASENHDSIFAKYVQAGQSIPGDSGKGLGLAICKSLVDLHQGTIGVTSELGSGSTFWFVIPLRHSTSTPLAEPQT